VTTYLSHALDYDEVELQRHLISATSGRCATCGEPEPCRRRLELSGQLAVLGRLPRRQPGVVGARVFGSGRPGSASQRWWLSRSAIRS